MVEITDRKSAEAWFEKQPQEACIAISLRAALRSAPGLGFAGKTNLDQIASKVFRALLTSSVAATSNSDDIKVSAALASLSANDARAIAARSSAAAQSAASAATLVATSAAPSSSPAAALSASAILASAASSADVGIDALSAVLSASSADATALGSNEAKVVDLLQTPLWLDKSEPKGWQRGRMKLLEFFRSDKETWRFWEYWYLAILDGTWTQWDLARDIVLIPDEVWEQGPEAIADAIRDIEAIRSLLDKAAARAQAEALKQNPKTASLCAEGLARHLKQVVETTKCDFNGLPEPFEPLAPLTAKLFLLSSSVLKAPSSETEAELVELLQSSATHIASLVERLRDAQAEVARLRVALDEAKDIAAQNRLREAAFQNPKTGWLRDFSIAVAGGAAGSAAGAIAPIFLPELYGYLTAGLDVLLGPEAKQTLADLGACYTEFVRPETVPDLMPPTADDLDKLTGDDWA